MKSLKWILPLCVLAIMLGGCPYGSNVPIDDPDMKVHKDLLGKWEMKESGNDVYMVSKADEHIYKIDAPGFMGGDRAVYTGYFCEVEGNLYLNMIGGEKSDKKYYFYKAEFNSTKTRVVLRPVTENITENFASPEDLRKFIKKHQDLSFFFGKDTAVLFKD